MGKSSIPDLAAAKSAIPFNGHPIEHPFARSIESYLDSIGKVPNSICRSNDQEAVWSFCTAPGLSLAYRLYKTQAMEVFLHLECAFGFCPEGGEDLVAAMLLREQHSHHFPILFALTEDRLLVAICRSYCAGVTEQHLLLRLDSMITFGVSCRERYVRAELGVHSLPQSWFKAA
jgi:hypothetical protein